MDNFFEHGEHRIPYELLWKKVKNINLRIRRDGRVLVSAPVKTPLSAVHAFVQSKAGWIAEKRGELLRQAEHAFTPEIRDGGRVMLFGEIVPVQVGHGAKDGVSLSGHRLLLTVRSGREPERLYESWYEKKCTEACADSLNRIFPYFSGVVLKKPELSLRYMKSRWGSCHVNRQKIVLNKHLLKVPAACMDYVTAHELTHFIHPNHSKAFYASLAAVMPDHQERRKLLQSYVSTLG